MEITINLPKLSSIDHREEGERPQLEQWQPLLLQLPPLHLASSLSLLQRQAQHINHL